MLPVYFAKRRHNGHLLAAGHDPETIEIVIGKCAVNLDFMARYIGFRYDDVVGIEATHLQDVFLLPPATGATFTTAGSSQRSYWHFSNLAIQEEVSKERVEADTLMLLRTSITNAIDGVGEGAVLAMSGGLDSTTAAAIAASMGYRLPTVTAQYDVGSRLDESPAARRVASLLGLEWFGEILTAEDFLDSWLNAYNFHTTPIATSSLVGYDLLVERIASRGFKALLLGSQADRHFAGNYPHYRYHLADMYRSNGIRFRDELGSWISRHSTPDFPKTSEDFIIWVSENVDLYHPGRITVRPQIVGDDLLLASGLQRGQSAESMPAVELSTYLRAYISQHIWRFGHDSTLARLRYGWGLGIEVGDLYSGTTLFEYLWSLPNHFKVSMGQNKVLLRRIASNFLPAYVFNAVEKVGFNVPVHEWMQTELYRRAIHTAVTESACELDGIIDVKGFRARLSTDRGLASMNPMFVWQIANAALWFRGR
jgi:asparagine synthetase B (glutamine-hydrolysing)